MAFTFDRSTRGFSLRSALGCGLAAQLAYAVADTVAATGQGDWGFAQLTPYASPSGAAYDTQGFLALRDDLAVLAFRGTEPENIRDWLTDAESVLVATDLGHVHKGFWNALDSIWAGLFRELQAAARTRPVWVTGHSLGAALATLAVARCDQAQVPVAGLYTFGSPRVGDASFANAYDERRAATTFRFVNNNDIVTRVPPREMSYRHVGSRKYLDRYGHLVTDTRILDLMLDSFEGSMLGLRKMFDQIAHQRQRNLPLPDFMDDHRMANYVDGIRKNL